MQLDAVLLGRGGPTLFVRYFEPDEPRAVVILLHGSMVHSEYYLPIALRLAQEGLVTAVPDLRGHGRSEGRRAHVSDYRDHIDDVERVSAWAMATWGLPLILTGESYGGLIAFLASGTIGQPVSRLVLAAPAFGLAAKLPSAVIRGSRFLARTLPLLRSPIPMNLAGVSHRADLEQLASRDPLLCRHYTIRFFVELLSAQTEALAIARHLNTPCLALLAGKDLVTDNRVSREVIGMVRGESRIVTYPEFFHAVLAEDPERVVADIVDFLYGRTPQAEPATG